MKLISNADNNQCKYSCIHLFIHFFHINITKCTIFRIKFQKSFYPNSREYVFTCCGSNHRIFFWFRIFKIKKNVFPKWIQFFYVKIIYKFSLMISVWFIWISSTKWSQCLRNFSFIFIKKPLTKNCLKTLGEKKLGIVATSSGYASLCEK